MIDQWVIDKLNPLKREKLVILADPQRMIRAGDQAVDGWAKENSFMWHCEWAGAVCPAARRWPISWVVASGVGEQNSGVRSQDSEDGQEPPAPVGRQSQLGHPQTVVCLRSRISPRRGAR